LDIQLPLTTQKLPFTLLTTVILKRIHYFHSQYIIKGGIIKYCRVAKNIAALIAV